MVASVLLLRDDLRIQLIDCYGTYANGHVIWASLADGGGSQCLICFDNRPESPTCHRLFCGARHPNNPAAELLELGCEEEGVIVPLLSRWLDSQEPWESGAYPLLLKELLQEALLRVGEPVLVRRSNW
jgi:hypothetical protein